MYGVIRYVFGAGGTGARIVKNYISIGSFLTIEFILKEKSSDSGWG